MSVMSDLCDPVEFAVVMRTVERQVPQAGDGHRSQVGILKGVDLSVRGGGMLHIVGPSGSGKSGWTKRARAKLAAMARELADCEAEQLWRGPLSVELKALDQVEGLIKQVEAKLK